MCIACVAKEKAVEDARFLESLSTALIDAMGIVAHMQQRGVALDADEQLVYDRLLPFVSDSPQAAPDGGMPAGLRETLQAVFPGATIVEGSPEQVAATIEKMASGKKDN